MKLSHAISTVYCSGIAMLAFGAVYRPEFLGALGASPGLLLIMAAVLMLPFLRRRPGTVSSAVRTPLLLAVGVAGSLASAAIYGWSHLLLGKFFALFLLSLVWLSPLLVADILRVGQIRTAVRVGLLICLLGFVFSDLFPSVLPGALRSLAFGGGLDQYLDDRPRGFTDEPSSFATLVGRMLLIHFLIMEAGRRFDPSRSLMFLAGMASCMVLLGSKGAVFSIALCLVAAGFGRKHWRYLLLLAPLAIWVGSTQSEAVVLDLEQFTSISTRLGMAVTGLAAGAVNPLGYGYYGFYGAIEQFGTWSMDVLGGALPLRFVEMVEIVDDLINVSTKSTILDMLMILGWAFIWSMWQLCKRIDLSDPRARAALVYLLVTSLYTSTNASVLFFLGIALLVRLYPRGVQPTADARLALRKARKQPQMDTAMERTTVTP